MWPLFIFFILIGVRLSYPPYEQHQCESVLGLRLPPFPASRRHVDLCARNKPSVPCKHGSAQLGRPAGERAIDKPGRLVNVCSLVGPPRVSFYLFFPPPFIFLYGHHKWVTSAAEGRLRLGGRQSVAKRRGKRNAIDGVAFALFMEPAVCLGTGSCLRRTLDRSPRPERKSLWEKMKSGTPLECISKSAFKQQRLSTKGFLMQQK